MGIAERMPNRRASYEQAETTPLCPGAAPTMTGLPGKGRVVPLLHGRVEGIQVHVEDNANVFTSMLFWTRTRVEVRVAPRGAHLCADEGEIEFHAKADRVCPSGGKGELK